MLNPVDMLGSATADSFRVALPMVLADPGIDAVIVLFVPPVAVDAADVGAAISQATADANQPDKPVLAAILAANGAPATLRVGRPDPVVRLPGGGRVRTRTRGRLRHLAAPLGRHGASARGRRHRSGSRGRHDRPGG